MSAGGDGGRVHRGPKRPTASTANLRRVAARESASARLQDRAARGELRYGMHVSATALMTCLVGSAVGHDHVHFVDGGDGGYTIAAKGLKLAAA